MDWSQAFILGIVQGLTEFIPISSTAHLRIVPHVLGWSDPGAAYSAVIQLGTLVAVLIYFREDVIKLISGALQSVLKQDFNMSSDSRLAWAILIGSLPIVVLGLSFKDWIEAEARGLNWIGSSLIIFAIFLYLSEKVSQQNREIASLRVRDVLMIGICQAFALIPGCSRSGSTITGGLFLGLTRENAARFSFLLGLPAIAGSGLLELASLVQQGLGEEGILNIVIGITAAFVSGYFSIDILLKFIKKYGTLSFVLYRIGLGTIILTMWV